MADEELTPEKARRVLTKLEGLFARIGRGDDAALRELFGDAVKDDERARSEEFPPPVDATSVRVVEGHIVELAFDDGEVRTRDLGPVLTGPVFDAIRSDPARFAEVRVDAARGTIVWPNGADIDSALLRYDDLWAEGLERRLIEDRRAALDLGAEFEAEGRPYAVLDDDGEVEIRGDD